MDGTRERRQVVRVVIVGAGFGGLEAAKTLRRAPVELTVLDRYNHHLFQPLLYQVATAVISPGDISSPIRTILRSPNTTVLLAEARSIDLERKVVVCEDGEVAFDFLVLATGATHSYFGHEEWSRCAPGLKTIDDALEMRERMLFAFEAAERETAPERQRDWLTFVIIGGGPTGVELAGALAYMTRHTLRGEFRHLDPTSARVVLLEGLPRILTAYPEELSASAQRSLERLGVEVQTSSMVTGVDAEGVTVGGKARIRARTVLWGAGVAASPLARSLGAPLDKAGRVKVTPALTMPGREDVFVIGDLAAVIGQGKGEQGKAGQGKPIPGVAPAAMQMGRHAAKNILRQLQGKPLVPFHYRDRGVFAVIGRGAAIGVLFNRWKMRGRLAWLLWVGVHITYLIGFRNRLSVLLNWAHTYFTKKRDVRLITGVHAQRLPPLSPASAQAAREQAPAQVEQQPAPAY